MVPCSMTLNVPKPSFQGYAYAIFYVEISQAMAWWPDLWLYPKSGTAKVFPQPSFVWITQFTTEIGSWILLLVWGKNKRPPYIGILLPISISTISIRMLFHQNRATRWGRGSNDVIDFFTKFQWTQARVSSPLNLRGFIPVSYLLGQMLQVGICIWCCVY